MVIAGFLELAVALLLGGCSSEEPEPRPDSPPAGVLPETVAIDMPTEPLRKVELVENNTEEVADWLLDFSDKLRRRDFTSARTWFSDSFAGEAPIELPVALESALPVDVQRRVYDADAAQVAGPAAFLGAWRDLIGPWEQVDSVLWKVKKADFDASGSWGKVKLFLRMLGTSSDGGRIALSGWAYARVENERGRWWLERFDLTALESTVRARPMFTDVSTSTGIARTGVRFGQPGNQSFAWNGAAGGDVDADGRWDVFLPSRGRNYLYRSVGDGTFAEEAALRGLQGPDEGTGALFFDVEGDGDSDLVVGYVSFQDESGALAGTPLQLFRNDGEGNFASENLEGSEPQPWAAYSLTAFDYDLDGYVDLYACGYGRIAEEHNNDWVEATNGSPNALLRNLEGKRFVDVAAELGVRGSQWSYASAAADYDEDGDLDLYVANDYGSNNLFRNDGERFTDVRAEEGVADRGNGMGVAWGDLTSDGALDLYVSNMSSTAGNRILDRLKDELDPEEYRTLKKLAAGNSIFRAAEDGFRALPSEAGGINGNWAWSTALVDLDLDGWLDVFLTNGYVTGDLPHDT